jgi:multicomponent Na+:H+ antiporter subunit G
LKDIITAMLMLVGSLFMLLSAFGILRMPDVFTRMHAATKVGTVGVSGIVLAVAVHFEEMKVVAPALLIIVFFLATAPVAAHMIGRAAYQFGVELWKGTVIDQWKNPPAKPQD